MVNFPKALKSTAGVVACAPEPFRYKDFTPSSSTYVAPSLRLFQEQRTTLTLQEFWGLWWDKRPVSLNALHCLEKNEQVKMKESILGWTKRCGITGYTFLLTVKSPQSQNTDCSFSFFLTNTRQPVTLIIITVLWSAHLTWESVPSRIQWLTMSAAWLRPFLFKKKKTELEGSVNSVNWRELILTLIF